MLATIQRCKLAGLAVGCLIGMALMQGCAFVRPGEEAGFTKRWSWAHMAWRNVRKQKMYFDNRNYYDKEGNFLEDNAKIAYMDFLEWSGYEMHPRFKENLWVTDFGLGKFTTVGMGIIVWANEPTQDFTGMEVLLLPTQIMPEHWYVQTDEAPAKIKTVHCRYGSVYLYGEGTPTPETRANIPKWLKLHTTVWKERVIYAGETTPLPKPVEKRWKQAGPMGAILTEYSTFHDLDGLRFTNPNVKPKKSG